MGLPISWGRMGNMDTASNRSHHCNYIQIISRLYPDYIQLISRLYPDYIQIISRLYPHRWLSTPDVPLYHDFWCQTSRPPSGGPGSAGSTSAGSGRAVGHFPPAHAEGVRPRSGNFDENCLGAPCTTKRYSNLQ